MAKPMTEKQREQLKQKIRWVCGYIVRGRDAARSWTVRFYHLQRVISVVLTVLGGAGVIAVQNGVVQHNGDLITLGGALALGTGIFTGLYQLWDTEKTAVQSLAARDAMDVVYDALESAVKSSEPAPGVNRVILEAEAHLRSFRPVIKMKVAPAQEVESLLAGLMTDVNEKDWLETVEEEDK
jgi:hypothetical protein